MVRRRIPFQTACNLGTRNFLITYVYTMIIYQHILLHNCDCLLINIQFQYDCWWKIFLIWTWLVSYIFWKCVHHFQDWFEWNWKIQVFDTQACWSNGIILTKWCKVDQFKKKTKFNKLQAAKWGLYLSTEVGLRI